MQKLQKFKKTELGEIPENWQYTEMKMLSTLSKDAILTGPFGSMLHSYDYVKEGTPLILIKNIQNGSIDDKDIPKISQKDVERLERYKVRNGDIVFSRVGRVGSAALIKEKHNGWLISGQTLRIRFDNPAVNSQFINYFIELDIFQKILKAGTLGSTRDSINTTILENSPVLLPTREEQDKIASILSNVDELIQKTEQNIEQTQRLKKGLIQRLLTKGIGHTKFKKENFGISFLNYNIPAEWKLVKIKDIASVHGRIGWKGLKREEYTESGPLMLSVWSLIDDYPYGIDYSVGVNRLSSFRYDESPEIKLKNGDVLLAKDGDIGRIGYVQSLPEPSTVNSHVVVVRTKNNEIKSEFLYWFMNSHIFQTYCKSFTSGTTVPLLSQINIKDAIIPIPSLNEQIIISSILYSFSNIIYKNKTHNKKIQHLKKGLMQQLLTGKIRV